ncbi:MAG: hypothetical protein V1820_05870 [archaeon]
MIRSLFEKSPEARIERELVPFLLRLSRIPKGTPARALVGRADGGEIGKLLNSAEREYLKGSGRKSLQACILKSFGRFRGRKVRIFAETLVTGISNNFDAAELVRKTASEIQEISAIEEKGRAARSIQKYTILASSGFFVPFILGATSSIIVLVSGISKGLAGFGIRTTGSPELLSGTLLAYSLILPGISAGFLSFGIESEGGGRVRRFLRLSALLSASALAAFLIGKRLLGV